MEACGSAWGTCCGGWPSAESVAHEPAARRAPSATAPTVEEGHLLADHVHMMVSIPPKYSVAQVIGYIKGKSAIHIAREYAGRPRNFVGQHFWARGYYVSTVDGMNG